MSYEKCCSNLRRHSCYRQKRLPGRLLRVPRAVAPSPGRRAAGGTIWVPVAGVRDGERRTCLGVRSPGLNSSVATSGPVTGQLAEHCELFTRTLQRGCSLQVGVLPAGGGGPCGREGVGVRGRRACPLRMCKRLGALGPSGDQSSALRGSPRSTCRSSWRRGFRSRRSGQGVGRSSRPAASGCWHRLASRAFCSQAGSPRSQLWIQER